MPTVTPVLAPEVGARQGDEGEQLLALFAKQSGEPLFEDEEKQEPAAGESETPVEASEDAAPDEVAAEEETPTEEVEPEPKLYEVKIDGQVEKVPLDELKAGYSRTSDYTRKTQATAAKERELAVRESAISQDRDRYIEGLKNVEALLTQHADEPDWTKLADELDPADFNRQRAQWDNRQRQLTTLRIKRETEEQKTFAQREQAHQEFLRAEQAKLFAAVPEWKDDAKARAEQAKLTEYVLRVGRDHGITEQALAGIDSAFPILMLRKAMLYDELMAVKPKVVKQTVPTPTAKPGTKAVQTKRSPVTEAAERLAQSHDPKDAEEYFLQRLIADEARPRR